MAETVAVSFVVPVFNSEVTLRELHSQIVEACGGENLSFEVVLVDDYSQDSSWAVIKTLSADNENVLGLRMSRNFGQHNALLLGIRQSSGTVIVTLDDDLQHSPSDALELILHVNPEGEYDLAYGLPSRRHHGWLRDFITAVGKGILTFFIGSRLAQHASPFRAFSHELRVVFEDFDAPDVNIDALLSWATSSYCTVPVAHYPRTHGASGYTRSLLFMHFFNMMTGFSTRPLRLASLIGLGLFFFGLAVFVYVGFSWLTGEIEVPGFTFIASLVSIFSGAQMLALGIIGEYLARMYSRSMSRPAYKFSERTRN